MKKIIASCSLYFLFLLCFSCDNQSSKNEGVETGKIEIDIKTAFYNVENLFDTIDDPKTNDKDYLPDGYYHWTKEKYNQKLENLARVIEALDADFVGLAEVENLEVLKDLVAKLENKRYQIVHYESHDLRGIDNAILYSYSWKLIDSKDITARLPNNGFAGPRGIIQAVFEKNASKLALFINHWPSRKKGREENRMAYSNTLRKSIEKLEMDNVLVLGDFNDTPLEPSLENLLEDEKLLNPFKNLALEGKGTSIFEKEWFLFDQILYSKSLILKEYGILDIPEIKNSKNSKYPDFPLRTFSGNRYNKLGCSDHFPVFLEISINK